MGSASLETPSSAEEPADAMTQQDLKPLLQLESTSSDSTPRSQLWQEQPDWASLAVKGEHVLLVTSDEEDGRSEVLGQGLQPGHVQ